MITVIAFMAVCLILFAAFIAAWWWLDRSARLDYDADCAAMDAAIWARRETVPPRELSPFGPVLAGLVKPSGSITPLHLVVDPVAEIEARANQYIHQMRADEAAYRKGIS